MKLLKCIIQPDKLAEVKTALAAIQIKGMTVSEVIGCDCQNTHKSGFKHDGLTEGSSARYEIEVVAPDSRVRQVLDTMIAAARSGKGDDGKIFIMNVDQAVRIRTGESDDAAL